ncbi:unnamed protein product [Urochloa decumbens]|uniref:F-box domain-containing protein n=1 Tax=Urochloa decumbens TaxID=240449 RepID=A0ABC9BWP7_9POAL
MSSFHRGHRRELATGGWAALPHDLLVDVFLELGPREIMLGAEITCRAWRRAALEEPSLWRRVGRDVIDEHGAALAPPMDYYDYDDRSNDVLLVEALKKLTLLEDLQIYFHYTLLSDQNTLQSVCQACPQLKKLVMIYASSIELELDEDDYKKELVDGPIRVMRNLHTLELDNVDLSCEGINAILDSCPLLQTLTIHGYFDKREMHNQLRMKCARVKELTLPKRVEHEDGIYYDDWHDGYDSVEEDNDLQ